MSIFRWLPACSTALLLGWATAASALRRDAQLPEFELQQFQGQSVSSGQWQGSVVLIDFWASWCGPCRQSFGMLNSLQQRHAARGLRVVGINVDEQLGDVESFLRSVPASFMVLLDPQGSQADAFDVLTMPSSFLFGRDGRLLWQHSGFHPKDQAAFTAAVEAALELPVKP